jgi:hypothetical protein
VPHQGHGLDYEPPPADAAAIVEATR